MKNQEIHIGCSSFNNNYWQKIFYPEGLARSKWFSYYCEYFGTYEINATFYRFPTEKSMKAWYEKSPEGFLFSVKANKIITHFRKFRDCKEDINKFYTICREGLKEKLGPVLFQLPPSFTFTDERLELIVANLNPNFQNVIEFRHESWWIPKVFETLAANNICFCTVSYPKLPEHLIAGSLTYIRMHGVPKLFYSEYSPSDIQRLFDEVVQNDVSAATFIYFNNTAGTGGILNALELKRIAAENQG